MFAESLLETSWTQRTQRSWTTLTSFALQVVALGALLTIPLLQTVGSPLARTISTPITLGRSRPAAARTAEPFHSSAVQLVPYTGRLIAPGHIPNRIDRGSDTSSEEPSVGDVVGNTEGSGPGVDLGMNIPISGSRPVMPAAVAPSTPARTFRTSSMMQGSLIRRVEPVYPPLARNARIQGAVVLEAVISKGGTIENLRMISGHPMLVSAAIEAVRQWKYRPYILNEEAIEVETQITVNFVLAN
jgi:protein TonB